MIMLFVASVCSLLVLAADAVPWNELAEFPEKSPWSEWMPVDFGVAEQWAMPASTCFEGHLNGDGNRIENYYNFDAQDKCPLCKGTKSTPGYAADPNNCAMFYSCVKWDAVWIPHHMSCPKCQFWDQEQLTCVQVYDAPICYPPTTTLSPNATTTTQPPPAPTVAPRRMLTCVTFDNGWDGVQGLNWLWVLNSGVRVLRRQSKCPVNKRCGYFNGRSNMEIPFFSSHYDNYEEFAVSLFYRRQSAGQGHQGLVSNDCYQTSPYEEANSLYVSSPAPGLLSAGMRSREGEAGISGASVSDVAFLIVQGGGQEASDDTWHHLAVSWNGTKVHVYLDGQTVSSQPFEGPIRRSHCPLVIGSFINQQNTYFNGFMDEVCFFRTALSPEEVAGIKDDPSIVYDM